MVGNALGISSRDIGMLCTSPNVNKWSKYKPVQLGGMPDRASNWWKGSDGNCGFTIKQVPSYQDIPAAMDGALNGWSYKKPIGTEASPYRLADFGGYKHDAPPFVMNFHVADVIAIDSDFVATCMFSRSGQDLLGIEDINTVSECYFGVYLKQKNGSSYRRATANIKIKDGGTSVVFPKNNITLGDWIAYPFLSEQIQPMFSSDVQSTYYTLPNVASKNIQVVSDFLNIEIMAEVNKFGELVDKDAINYTIQISNLGGGQTFVNNNIMFRFGNKSHTDPIEQGEKMKSLGDIYVGAGETKTITGTQLGTITIVDSQYGAKVYVLLQSGTKVDSVNVLVPR